MKGVYSQWAPHSLITNDFEKQIIRIYALINALLFIEVIFIFALQPLRDFSLETVDEILI